MAFLTYDEILNKNLIERSEILRKSEATIKIFLSHSSEDDKFIEGVKAFFSNYSADIYADNGDERLPEYASPETAQILRKEILSNNRFVLLLSKFSIQSGWVPWELGIADGQKGMAKVGILPISASPVEGDWAKREYLGLYPLIKKLNSGKWVVTDPRDGKYWPLQRWLSGSVS